MNPTGFVAASMAPAGDGNGDSDQYRQANDGGNVQHGYSLSLLSAVRETLLHMGA
jgi:hypothetical protein